MRRGAWGNQPESLIACSSNGVIRVRSLERLGVPSATSYRRCRPHGPWQRLLPGVVALHDGPMSRLQEVSAALLYGGQEAIVTGTEACRRYGLRDVRSEGTVHLLVPIDRKPHSSGFALVERTERMPAAVTRAGVPLAPLPRALIDASRRMSAMDPCRALLTEAVQRRMTTHNELTRELARGSTRGSAIPRRVLAEMDSGARSVAEIAAQRLWRRSGLPSASWNGRLRGPDDAYIATPDAWVDEVGFAWEVDSVSHHGDPDGFAKTVARNGRYVAAGVIVLQTLPARIRDEPDAVLRDLRASYAAAARRPRPDVVFHPAP